MYLIIIRLKLFIGQKLETHALRIILYLNMLINNFIIFTHDLDFGTLLALTHKSGPSVIQVRNQNILPTAIDKTVISVLNKYQKELEKGALISIDEKKSRVRILPIQKD